MVTNLFYTQDGLCRKDKQGMPTPLCSPDAFCNPNLTGGNITSLQFNNQLVLSFLTDSLVTKHYQTPSYFILDKSVSLSNENKDLNTSIIII